MLRHEQKAHRVTVTADADGRIHVTCSRGDLDKQLGENPSVTDVAQAAEDHWGRPL